MSNPSATYLKQLMANGKPNSKPLGATLAESYEPASVEAHWYKAWISEKQFDVSASSANGSSKDKKFVICLPPPNVTGYLHAGHALTASIEDALVRWNAMCGRTSLWIPGTDHAGIGTQAVVEKVLYRDHKLSKHDLGREKFVERVWEWKNEKGDRICEQLGRMGCRLDWNRQYFTMSDDLSVAVTEAFCRFHESGKMFRDVRMVNWCSNLRSAVSDLEVDTEHVVKRTLRQLPGTTEKVEVGVLVHFKYQVVASSKASSPKSGSSPKTSSSSPKNEEPEYITVATTRLETMLGDVAVAVNPTDERYTHLVGKRLIHPFFPDRKVVVVADSYVDKAFGTGAVKITPSHDNNDLALGKRHGLPFINILTDDGHINENGGEFKGLHRYVARRQVEAKLKTLGLYVDKKDHEMDIPICSRSGDIIEPMLKYQWWLNQEVEAKRAADAVRNKELIIKPENTHEPAWFNWMDNIRDWCVSRQLWWGHRIPAYRVVGGLPAGYVAKDDGPWFVGRTLEEATHNASKSLGVPASALKLVQDEDVLDTWFSSGLLPMSALGWPNVKHEDMQAFFPTTMLETGYDILTFWVARMVMMSLALENVLPFKTVYLHGLIRDAYGRKMTKSLGNVIDPMEVIEGISLPDMLTKLRSGNLQESEMKTSEKLITTEYPEGIPSCGADALRFCMLDYTKQAWSINLNVNVIVRFRHFCNKIWNATKFALSYFPAGWTPSSNVNSFMPKARLEDKWILSRLSKTCLDVNKAFETYAFYDATTAMYAFWYYDLCDVYLEAIKPRLRSKQDGATDQATAESSDSQLCPEVALECLYLCLNWGLRLLHPTMPFVTEELYQYIPKNATHTKFIGQQTYPIHSVAWLDVRSEDQLELVKSIAAAIRSQYVTLGVKAGCKPPCYVTLEQFKGDAFIKENSLIISTLSKVGDVHSSSAIDEATLKQMPMAVVNESCKVFMDIRDAVDPAAEIAKLRKKLTTLETNLASYVKKRQAPGYTDKVPAAVQAMNSEKETGLTKQIEETHEAIHTLSRLVPS